MLARELGGGGKEGKEGRKNEEEELTRCGEQDGTGWKKRREIGERSALYICVCVRRWWWWWFVGRGKI